LSDIGKLNWKKVVTADGFTIGEVEGGDIDTANWQILHIHVSLNDEATKEFGLKKPFLGRVLVCLPVDFVRTVGETVVLKKSFQELKNVKECQEFSVKGGKS
jgi:sporulation protein YlmC with PRC-barrel domain